MPFSPLGSMISNLDTAGAKNAKPEPVRRFAKRPGSFADSRS